MSEHKVSRNCPVCEAPLGANDGDCCQSCTYEPDAVEEANALAQATRERAELESALADEKRTIEKLIRERDIAISARVLRSELSAAEKAKRKLSERVAELEAEWNVAVANRELAEDEARQLRCERDELHDRLESSRYANSKLREQMIHEPTLRYQVAMRALQGLLAAGRYTDYGFQVKMASVSGDRYVGCDLETVVRDSLLVADAFLKERSR